MKTITLTFYECEHYGDLDNYMNDIRLSGGRIVSSKVNYDNETGMVEVNVESTQDFFTRFQETEASGFSNCPSKYMI